jgi:hypothetical protein
MRLSRRSFLAGLAAPATPTDIRVFHNDGGWCWFEDERVLLLDGKVIGGVVASGWRGPARKGQVEVFEYDLARKSSQLFALKSPKTAEDRRNWLDDHNSPAFVVRPDGKLVTFYAQHGREEKIYYRVSTSPRRGHEWGEERVFIPSVKTRATYQNLFYLSGEKRIYDFYRGFDNSFKPSYAWSEDMGETWKPGGVLINVPTQFRHRPYVKYCSNGRDTVHLLYTDGHPRDFDNSVYHVVFRGGQLLSSEGLRLASIMEGLKSPDQGTLVYKGDANNVAWVHDTHLDSQGHPVVVFSTQKDSAGLPSKQGGHDFRYHRAAWTGKQWQVEEIAFGGSKLYAGEDDYTGLIALDPYDTDSVFISTNADPVTGLPLKSAADGQRHWEIYRARKPVLGKWSWIPVTKDSTRDNLRPVVASGDRNPRVVLWLAGKIRSYTDFEYEVVGFPEARR